jgi:putative two-component system hydrogenase maturation factor HypX/HoxX
MGCGDLQATAELDAGPIWASYEFVLDANPPSKSSLYRGQVTDAAVRGVLEAVARIESGEFQSGVWRPETSSDFPSAVRGCLRAPMRQADRAIDWVHDKAAVIVRKIRAADSAPGVRSTLFGKSYFLYGAHEEQCLKGPPGQVLARRDGAICIGTIDGAVWVSHLKSKGEPDAQRQTWHLSQSGSGWKFSDTEQPSVDGIKLSAARVLGPLLRGVPEAPLPIDAPADHRTFREIVYTEEAQIGYLSFDFYNGAVSTAQCYRLRDAFLYARSRPTRVIVLLGGRHFWSNGIDLNAIEASVNPAEESWRNINAIDDLIVEILNTTCHLVIAGLRGNAGAGGAILALAADRVYAMSGVVLNPHYRSMGLYGSEYWTYTLPRRVGPKRALELTEACQPIGAQVAHQIGLIDDAFGNDVKSFEAELRERVARLAQDREFRGMLRKKHETRLDDEYYKPLAADRAEELNRMSVNFFGPNHAYHEARRRFVFKGQLRA